MAKGRGPRSHPVYDVWAEMIQRCTNPRHRRYADYGGRGIGVCLRWRGSFAAFLEDMGPRPEGLTLERRDNSRGYEPSNCCWATRAEQSLNKRRYKNNSTGLSGVEWDARCGGRYRVNIRRQGKRVHLGFTSDFFEACCRRKAAEAADRDRTRD